MIGFTPNDVPFKTKQEEDSDDLNFDKVWEEKLDLASSESRDAYSTYDEHYRK
jgi:hypothetical protein